MQGPVHAQLAPVRRRQQWLLILRTVAVGLLAGSLGGFLLGLGRWLAGWPFPVLAGIGLVAAGPVLGLLV